MLLSTIAHVFRGKKSNLKFFFFNIYKFIVKNLKVGNIRKMSKMLKIKYVKGIPCIVLDEDIEKKISEFQDWKKKNDFMFFKQSKDLSNLKDVLNALKKKLDEHKKEE